MKEVTVTVFIAEKNIQRRRELMHLSAAGSERYGLVKIVLDDLRRSCTILRSG